MKYHNNEYTIVTEPPLDDSLYDAALDAFDEYDIEYEEV